ncbi:hypothetical protein LXA43DRAFT_171604 [Ganoderma leucocontextum]|nr:hypothetical protein LXA43DRAFT_171604 [Ganoderma leucocontextum]
MKFNAFALTIVAAVASVHAQSSTSGSAAAPTATTGLSPCILQCTTQAASSAGCSSVTDISCVCSNTKFQQAALTCLQQSCTAAEVQAAMALQAQECGSASSAASSGASSATSVPSSAAASSSGTRSGAASSSGSASHASSGASSRSTATTATTAQSAGTAAASQSGNAARADLSIARGGLAGVVVAVMGVAAGAAFML